MDRNLSKNNETVIQLILLLLASLFLFYLAAFRPIGMDNDSITYKYEILAFYYGFSEIKEPAFIFFAFISKAFFDESVRSVFVMYAFFAIFIKTYAIARYSQNIFLSIVIYAGMFFILHDMTQIRVGLASAFFLLSIPDLIDNNKKSYLFKIFLSCLCHFSAVVLLPLVFLSSKKINFRVILSAPVIMLVFTLIIGDMNNILISLFSYLPAPLSTKAISYIIGMQELGRFDSVNVFSKFTLSAFVFFIVYIYACYKTKIMNPDDVIYLKLFSVMLTIFYLFSSVPVLASRTFELFAVSFIFSLPAIAMKFKPSWFISFIIFLWVCLYCYLVNLKLIGM